MTTISPATQVSSPPAPSHAHSGKGRMAHAIADQEQSGALSSTDATALTSALDSIDTSLQGDSTSTTGVSGGADTAGGTRLDPSQMKDRIDSLIGDQVSSGALTGDQASELKNLFSSHGTSVTSATAATGGSPPSGPPPSGPDASGTDSASVSGSSPSTASTSDLLSTFMQQLQAAQSNYSGYAASGTTASTQASALLFDFKS